MSSFLNDLLGSIDNTKQVFFPESSLQKIFLIIYVSKEPVSIQDISEKTGLSLASVSNKSKILLANGIVKKVFKQGSRELYLKSIYSLPKTISIHIKQKINVLKQQETELQTMSKNLDSSEKNISDSLRKDLKKVRKAHEHMLNELGEMD
ncbi:MAG: hypothetical protein ACQESC_00115 [Nanobdellota archaeon]